MQETAQQYIQRILGNLDGQEPLKVQQSTAKKLDSLIKLARNNSHNGLSRESGRSLKFWPIWLTRSLSAAGGCG